MHNHIAPAQLWIGPREHTQQQSIIFLQHNLCTENGCGTCIICRHIQEKQHHSVMWLTTERAYTLEDLDSLFETLAFTNDENQLFFFIITHADRLNAACANRLLKSVEEPPAGYHFIFLATQLNNVLPTIRSRCMITTMQAVARQENNPFISFFTTDHADPLTFMQILESSALSEHESSEFVDQLLDYFSKTAGQSSLQRITLLQSALTRHPMPGSTKIFWRNLFLQIYAHESVAMSDIPSTLKNKERASTPERT